MSKTSSIAVAVGEANNGICSRGVAYDAQFAIVGAGFDVCELISFLLPKFIFIL
jgi:hypothetical protein